MDWPDHLRKREHLPEVERFLQPVLVNSTRTEEWGLRDQGARHVQSQSDREIYRFEHQTDTGELIESEVRPQSEHRTTSEQIKAENWTSPPPKSHRNTQSSDFDKDSRRSHIALAAILASYSVALMQRRLTTLSDWRWFKASAASAPEIYNRFRGLETR